MATRRDLVEAQACQRRRLVAAFVAGAPGGLEAEPARPMRAIAAGVALAVLMLAGVAVAGLVAPRTDPDWLRDGTLVASRAGGDLYLVHWVAGRPTLRPVTNAMSARLLLGEQETVTATAADIAAQPIGPQIGIPDPPAQVAPPGRLVPSGWTACTREGSGVSLEVADTTGPGEATGSQVVAVDGRTYVVTAAGRAATSARPALAAAFPLDPRRVDQVLDQLALTARPVTVDRVWLSLVAAGAPLAGASFDLGRPGRVGYAAATGVPGLRAGQLATLGDHLYLATETGLARLTPFAAAVWVGLGRASTTVRLTGLPRLRTGAYPGSWPAAAAPPARGDACLRLRTDAGAAPTVAVLTGSSDRLAGLAPGRVRAVVTPGHGALVRAGGFGSARGSGPFLVAADGRSYAIVDPVEETVEHLGYAGVDPPVVPDAWLRLLPSGPPLSADLAGRSPVADSGSAS